jgi:hypothetical protein
MNKESYDKFYSYLCEVVRYYQEHKTLRNFSLLAKKWRCKAITQDLFYLYDLHRIEYPCVPSKDTADLIRDILAEKDNKPRKKKPFNEDDFVAWERNGFRSVAHIRSDGLFSICLNYRGRKDEVNRLWEVDELPNDVALEKANMSDIKRLALHLIKDCYKENI